MALLIGAPEMEKIQDVLRLPGLKFPNGGIVIGKKNIDLMVALGAIDFHNGRRPQAGKQLTVVRRLRVLFGAAIRVQKEGVFDIDSDRFNAEVLQRISNDHGSMTKYLTPKSLRLAIDLYRKGFVRSGWKRIPKHPVKPKQKQLLVSDPAQGDTATPSQDVGEESLEILEPIEPIADRVKLEKVVKEWMILRGIERSKKLAAKNAPAQNPTVEKPTFVFKDVDFPQQKPDESIDAYMMRLRNEFQDLHRKKQSKRFVLSYVSEQRRLLLDKQSEEIEGYKKLSDQRRERLDEQHDEIEGYKKLSEQRRERLDKQFDEIQELKKRIADMQHDLDTHADVFGRQDDMIQRQDQLNDKVNQAIELQIEMLKLELAIIRRQNQLADKLNDIKDRQVAIMRGQDVIMHGQDAILHGEDAIIGRQDDILRRQDQLGYRQDAVFRRQDAIMDGQDDIMDGQDAIMRGQDKIMYDQGYHITKVEEIVVEQDKIMKKQNEVLAKAIETMDTQKEALARQEDTRRRRAAALESIGIYPEALDEGLLVFRPGFQPGRFPESYERSTGPRGL